MRWCENGMRVPSSSCTASAWTTPLCMGRGSIDHSHHHCIEVQASAQSSCPACRSPPLLPLVMTAGGWLIACTQLCVHLHACSMRWTMARMPPHLAFIAHCLSAEASACNDLVRCQVRGIPLLLDVL